MKWSNFFLFGPSYPSEARLRRAFAAKRVLITGAGRGIGAALARQLAAAGAELWLVARSEAALAELCAEIQAKGGKARYSVCDLYQVQTSENLLQAIKDEWGATGMDWIFHNAGKSIRRSLWASLDRLHDFERTMRLNYLAPVQLSLALLPLLERRAGGMISSSAANVRLLPPMYWAAYQASKVAMEQWMSCIEPECQARGIHIGRAFLPLVRTEMIAPTPHYQNAAALEAEEAAGILANLAARRKRLWQPWWLGPLQLVLPWLAWLWPRLQSWNAKFRKF